MKLNSKIIVSEKWAAFEAGLEISEKLSNFKNINFLILFATIQYEKNGGFENLLKGVYQKIPKDTRLVGGTVLGFMTNEDSFIHGAVCVAISYKNMDIAIGFSQNTKRNPIRVADESSRMVKSTLNDSNFKNKLLFSIISGTEILKFPFSDPKAIIKFNFPDSVCDYFLKFARLAFQKGFGKEDDILERIIENLPGYDIIGGSTVDYKMLSNYQFMNQKVLKNAIVLLGISTNLDYKINFACGAKESRIKFKITKISKDKQVIHEINGKPALDELISLMGWPREIILDERRWTNILPRFPLGFYKSGRIILRPFTLIIGHSLAFMSKIESNDAFVTLMSGSDILHAINELSLNDKNSFNLLISCAVRGMGLGRNVEIERQKLRNIFKEKPFLLIYTAGEAFRRKNEPLNYLNESVVSIALKDGK